MQQSPHDPSTSRWRRGTGYSGPERRAGYSLRDKLILALLGLMVTSGGTLALNVGQLVGGQEGHGVRIAAAESGMERMASIIASASTATQVLVERVTSLGSRVAAVEGRQDTAERVTARTVSQIDARLARFDDQLSRLREVAAEQGAAIAEQRRTDAETKATLDDIRRMVSTLQRAMVAGSPAE